MMGRRLGGTGRIYVHDDVGDVHHFDPGDEVPKWAADQITNPNAWGSTEDAADPAEESGVGGDMKLPYAKWVKADLQTEVARRNEGRDEDDLVVVEGKGNVPDLVAALEGDDAAHSDA